MRNEPPSRGPMGSTAPTSTTVDQDGPAWTPPIRLRTLLAFAVIVGAGFWAYPRAVAAWKLHDAATTLADYALCMAGPTGPSLLRDNPTEFRRIVRRRLVSSAAGERPFAECAKAAGRLVGAVEVERAHRATAWSFVEFGGAAADRAAKGRRGELTLSSIRVSTRPVAALAKEAWPFVRGGYTKLVKPSLAAHEATHPVELPKPALGRGLPNWPARYRAVRRAGSSTLLAVGRAANLAVFRTRDGGLNWKPVSPRHPEVSAFAERCPAGDSRSFTFGLSDGQDRWTVTSLGPDGVPSTVELVPVDLQVFSAACDDRAVVAAVKAEDANDVTLHLCHYRRSCRPLPLPRFSGVGALPKYPLDVARIDGVTVVATTMHGIIRVASTRDDGRTWTPWTVAFDRDAHSAAEVKSGMPSRLLALGDRVLLYAGAENPATPYLVLASTDYGASWRSR